MRGSDGPEGRWFSPALPTAANVILGTLWAFSAYGGWGRTAFCHVEGGIDRHCADGFEQGVAVSAVPASLAVLLVAACWAFPSLRRDADLFDALLAVAAITWGLAEGVLLTTGYLVEP